MLRAPTGGVPPWLALAVILVRPCFSHWHEEWEAGQTYSYPWYEQPWVSRVNSFYCDKDCAARLEAAPTVDREFKALVELLNQTTGGPRNPYRGAFEGLDEYVEGQLNGPELSRQAASLATWKHMEGWESILTAHTSALTLCTELKLDGNEIFTRQLCYDKIFASDGGPLFPSPRWSVVEDCCLKFNRTIGHGEDAFFWTDAYQQDVNGQDVQGYNLRAGVMVGGMGLVVGRYGRILRTSDGGSSWSRINSPTTAHLHGLSFNHENTHSGEEYDALEESTGWAVGDEGTILQTDDRGETWREITNDVLPRASTPPSLPTHPHTEPLSLTLSPSLAPTIALALALP